MRMPKNKSEIMGRKLIFAVSASGSSRLYHIYDRVDPPAASVVPVFGDKLGRNLTGKGICRIQELYGPV